MSKENEFKTLGNLSPAPGSNISKKRLGRGIGSGLGKTSARGGKGQTARKGGGIRAGFEGGQTPLYRRLPKRGFTNPFRVEFNCINLESLNSFEHDSLVDSASLSAKGLVRNPQLPIKILAKGVLSKRLKVNVDGMSVSAREAVLKVGGSVVIKE